MSIIKELYMRRKCLEEISDLFDSDSNPTSSISNTSIHIGIIWYGEYYSKIYIDHKYLYDEFCGSIKFYQYIELSCI